MKNLIILILTIATFFIQNMMLADTITGGINKNDTLNKVVDSKTGIGIKGAVVSIPKLNFKTITSDDGTFKLNTEIMGKYVMIIKHEGYKPFSITIDETYTKHPLKIGIEKTNSFDIMISDEIYHLGDNIFSKSSANCKEFKTKSVGPSYTKEFNMQRPPAGKRAYIVLGSVIGLDTKEAKLMRQNSIEFAYSTPAEIYFNNQLIAQLNLNGDNIQIPIPLRLISNTNTVTIKTGHNLFQRNYTDYDDIEIANISIEVKDDNLANTD